MSEQESLFHTIGASVNNSEKSQMFGKPCYKINKKAFVCFYQECMVFKLTGETHAEALGVNGAELFDPSGKKRPMKEWVQVPYLHHQHWGKFAQSAAAYVAG